MIIWHNNQLHSIVFSGTKQIIFSFRLGLVALPATCYLAPWQWPVTAARPLPSRSRGPLNSAPGAACASPTTVLQPAHGGLLYRTKTMLHFHPRRRPRAPLDARTPSPGYIGAMANPFGIALSRVWTEWAAKRGVSETIAAAVYLLSENRRAEEVVGELNPSELERVIHVIGQQPDRFPRGTLAALQDSRPTPPPAWISVLARSSDALGKNIGACRLGKAGGRSSRSGEAGSPWSRD